MSQPPRTALIGPFVMLISAAILGYFGFSPQFLHTSPTGQYLLFVVIYEYTLKVSAIALLVCAGVTFFHQIAGNILYGVCGILCAGGLTTAGVMDLADTQNMVQDPWLTFLFAVIILFVGVASLRDGLAALSASRSGAPGPGSDAP